MVRTNSEAAPSSAAVERDAPQHSNVSSAEAVEWQPCCDHRTCNGVGGAAIMSPSSRSSAVPVPHLTVDEERLFADLAGTGGLTRQASTFQRKEVVEAVAERVADRTPVMMGKAHLRHFLTRGSGRCYPAPA